MGRTARFDQFRTSLDADPVEQDVLTTVKVSSQVKLM